jgi:hypothetical protein
MIVLNKVLWKYPRSEAGYNISTLAPRIVEGDEKGTRCLGVHLGHSVIAGHIYKDLVLQVGC